MIIDTFERALSYDLGPLWERIFPEFLALRAKGEELALGRYELGDGVFINVEEYAPKEWDVARFECHDKMADVQTLLMGDEYIDIMARGAEVELGEESERFDERDLYFYKGKPEVPIYIRCLGTDGAVGGELPLVRGMVIPQLYNGAIHLLQHAGGAPVDRVRVALVVVTKFTKGPANHRKRCGVQHDATRLLHDRIVEVACDLIIEDGVVAIMLDPQAIGLDKQLLPISRMGCEKVTKMGILIHADSFLFR